MLPPGASSGMSDILPRTSCCKISLPLRSAPGGNTDSGPANTSFRHSSQICSGADANLVARLCRALIWGGRSQSSGLAQFLIRLSERSRNRAPLCNGNVGPVLDLVFRTFRRPGNPLILLLWIFHATGSELLSPVPKSSIGNSSLQKGGVIYTAVLFHHILLMYLSVLLQRYQIQHPLYL